MANTPKVVRKAGKLAGTAAREEIKKPGVTRTGSPKQSKSEKTFMKTYKSDPKNYVGWKATEPAIKSDKKSGPKSSPAAKKKTK
jgi:hypothetical protein